MYIDDLKKTGNSYAFLVTVPFTIVEAMSFVIDNDLKNADLYLSEVVSDSDDIGKRIKETGIFRNVFIVKNLLLTYPITLKKCYQVVCNKNSMIRDMKNRKYDYAFYNNSGFLVNSIFYTGIYGGNKCAKHIFLEHGNYTYINKYSEKPWYLKPLINLFGLKCMDGSQLDRVFMYEPELSAVEQDAPVEKMKKIDINNEYLRASLNKAFLYSPQTDEFLNKKAIIFEQGKLKVDFDKELFWEKVFECIYKKENVIIKPHPRQVNSTLKDFGIDVCKNNTIPWEILCLNNDLSNKVQITIFSQSCISPKLVFGQEPTVIFLYKLLPISYDFLGKGVIQFADSIGSLYKDKEKYFVPESFDELREYCQTHDIF